MTHTSTAAHSMQTQAPRAQATAAFERRLRAIVAANMGACSFNARALARAAAMSPRTLQLHMRKHRLPTPGERLRRARLQHAGTLLRSGRFGTVGEVAAAVGMSRPHFCRLYRARVGHPPGKDLLKI